MAIDAIASPIATTKFLAWSSPCRVGETISSPEPKQASRIVIPTEVLLLPSEWFDGARNLLFSSSCLCSLPLLH